MGGSQPSWLPWLKLGLIPQLTGAAWRRLGARFGPPHAILEQPVGALATAVDADLARQIVAGPDPARLQEAITWLDAANRALLTPDDDRYPERLLQSAAAPPVLYAEGRLELLQPESLAIVGSRNATPQGVRNAHTFAHAVAAANVTVVSGMALGIDAAAHAAALEEIGSTIAVLGSGADVVYPRRNAALFEQIRSDGLILSEFPLGTPPLASNFPRRNRIICGLARGCLVVEAALASGSLITARLAVELGRDVFAIPGSIHSPLSKGCHYLIKQGAKLVETAEEVLEEFGSTRGQAADNASTATQAHEGSPLLDQLGYEPCDLDSLIERCRSSAEALLPRLTELELEGLVARLPDGRYQRVK